jgi:hypothetical protein
MAAQLAASQEGLISVRKYYFISIICFVRLLALRPLLAWPIVPVSGDNEDDCGETDGM